MVYRMLPLTWRISETFMMARPVRCEWSLFYCKPYWGI
jgi:hypothetical protein